MQPAVSKRSQSTDHAKLPGCPDIVLGVYRRDGSHACNRWIIYCRAAPGARHSEPLTQGIMGMQVRWLPAWQSLVLDIVHESTG